MSNFGNFPTPPVNIRIYATNEITKLNNEIKDAFPFTLLSAEPLANVIYSYEVQRSFRLLNDINLLIKVAVALSNGSDRPPAAAKLCYPGLDHR